MRELVALPDQFRIRLSSIEATEVTRELIQVMADHPHRVCPHLHLCLQSGSDRVLRRMRRRWGTRMFLDRCALIRKAIESPALTTDVIVGFPGETEEDFLATCDTVRAAGFSKIHLFPFSPRRGTPAAEMTDQIQPEVKQQRMDRLGQLEKELRSDYFRHLIGRQLSVIAESSETIANADGSQSHRLRGTACRYATTQWLSNDPIKLGTLCPVTAIDAKNEIVIGRRS